MSKEVNKELEYEVAMRKSTGKKTLEALKKLNIKSPNTSNKIKVAPGLWVTPDKPIENEKEKQAFIEYMQIKFQNQLKYLCQI
jgi:hypothetical protein